MYHGILDQTRKSCAGWNIAEGDVYDEDDEDDEDDDAEDAMLLCGGEVGCVCHWICVTPDVRYDHQKEKTPHLVRSLSPPLGLTVD